MRDAEDAIRALDGNDLDGARVSVAFARRRGDPPPDRRGPPGGGYDRYDRGPPPPGDYGAPRLPP